MLCYKICERQILTLPLHAYDMPKQISHNPVSRIYSKQFAHETNKSSILPGMIKKYRIAAFREGLCKHQFKVQEKSVQIVPGEVFQFGLTGNGQKQWREWMESLSGMMV